MLTVANLDTGAVASTTVVPGGSEPRPDPAGRWRVRLDPLVRHLAATVGATWLADLAGKPYAEQILTLPGWRPDLPVARRLDLEARALAASTGGDWRVWLGRSVPPPERRPARELDRLCAVADLLCLDLVVEARRRWFDGGLLWDVRFEVPGAPVPPEPTGRADTLPAALAGTAVTDALRGLAARGRTVTARYLRPGGPPRAGPVTAGTDPGALQRRIVTDAGDPRLLGAQAVWRDRRWWHTPLRTADRAAAGQAPVRVAEPPVPLCCGDPIGHSPCPDCDPDTPAPPCPCTSGGHPAEVTCPDCRGTGTRPWWLPCPSCGGTRRIHHGVVVTLTDLRTRAVHLNWAADGGRTARPPVLDLPPPARPAIPPRPGPARRGPDRAGGGDRAGADGGPVVRLGEEYRLARWAAVFGVRPGDLTELDGGQPVGAGLRDGLVTLPEPGVDPLRRHLASLARGRPAARVLVHAAVPAGPSLARLLRLALGLDLAALVTVRAPRPRPGDPDADDGPGWAWHVGMSAPEAPVGPVDPVHPGLPVALARCVAHLGATLAATVPADPYRAVAVPQAPRPYRVEAGVGLLDRLAAAHPGRPVTARFDRAGCAVYLHDPVPCRLAGAGTLAEVVTGLLG